LISSRNNKYVDTLAVQKILLNITHHSRQIQAAQKTPYEGTTPSELRNIADNVLYLMTTTILPMHKVLWPYLFEPLTKGEFTPSVGIVCKCIAYIARIKRDEQHPDYLIDFDVQCSFFIVKKKKA